MRAALFAELQRAGAGRFGGPRSGFPSEMSVERDREGLVRPADQISFEGLPRVRRKGRWRCDRGRWQRHRRVAHHETLRFEKSVDITAPNRNARRRKQPMAVIAEGWCGDEV